jgi:predicted ATP-dependent endonuclease of OLD family
MSSLYNLTQDFLDTVAQLEELELDQETVNDTLESLQMPIEQKAENIVKYMKELEALAEMKKTESKRLSESASADLKKAESLKTYLQQNLERTGIKKLQAGIFTLAFRKGSEVVEIDESKVPLFHEAPRFYKAQEPKFLGKTELKTLIKEEGIIIPGVTLVRKQDSLVIK